MTLLAATTAVAPRVGAATMIALVVTGQVLCSLALDQWGLLGLATHAITLHRALAAGLILSGVLLIK